MGVEPTQDGITAPQTVLKTAPVTGPEAAPCSVSHAKEEGGRRYPWRPPSVLSFFKLIPQWSHPLPETAQPW